MIADNDERPQRTELSTTPDTNDKTAELQAALLEAGLGSRHEWGYWDKPTLQSAAALHKILAARGWRPPPN
jgi:hypothetical protein